MSFITHKVRVQHQVCREIEIEVTLFPDDPADPEEIALERAKHEPSRSWKTIEEIWDVADSKAETTELIAYEDEADGHDGRKFFNINSVHTPDGIWRYARVYECAGQPGLYRISVHEHKHNRETWFGGKVLWDLDTTDWKKAKRQARDFVRRKLNP